jgi:hypothetical protein
LALFWGEQCFWESHHRFWVVQRKRCNYQTAFKGEQKVQLDETVTRLITERKIPPMIVVGVIDAGTDRGDHHFSASANAAPEELSTVIPVLHTCSREI